MKLVRRQQQILSINIKRNVSLDQGHKGSLEWIFITPPPLGGAVRYRSFPSVRAHVGGGSCRVSRKFVNVFHHQKRKQHRA